jgi:hypothetical protein
MSIQVFGALVVIAYKRSDSLNQVLNALSSALVPEYQEIVFVQQGNFPEVTKIINSFHSLPSRHLRVERIEAKSPGQAINLNVHEGISEAFQHPEIDLVTVLEDDIVISKDFLKFNIEAYKQNILNPSFRGINGFSGIPRTVDNEITFSKQRFGLGWGWSIPRKTWLELQNFWTGKENHNWDGMVESYCKTGYVIMPSQSRILNLGFGQDATHTSSSSSEQVAEIESKLVASFTQNLTGQTNFIEVREHQNWRSDCLPYLGRDSIKAKAVQHLYELQLLFRIKHHNFERTARAKAKILGLLQLVIQGLYAPYVR